jgi:pimeloyl-ACP methyl ester carboxylesterase
MGKGTLAAAVASLLLAAIVGAGPAAAAGPVPRFEPQPSCPNPLGLPALATARCGFLVVPLRHANPAGPTIRLQVAIVPAASGHPAPDPVVHLTGGPGGVATLESQQLVASGLNRDRDLILVNQRGTYGSEPALTCASIDAFGRRLLGLRYDADSTRRLHVAATRACRADFLKRGVDLAAFNTEENAADIADLRTALGYDAYNLFGVSYGTYLALNVLRAHPEGIRSVTLDSPVPPQLVAFPGFWPNARDGFQALFRACAVQTVCRTRHPHLEATFTRLVRTLEAKPAVATVPDPATGKPVRVVLDGGALVNWLVAMSFQTGAYADVPEWIDELAAGHPEAIATSRAGQVTPPGFVGYGLSFGVICREWAPSSTRADVLAAGLEALPAYPRSVLREPPQFTYNADDCDVWDVPPAPAAERATVESDVPTLILSGGFDAVTPHAWAEGAAEGLSDARIIPVPGVGHFALPESPCAQSVVGSFLDDPSAPDISCVPRMRPPVLN